jgi:hypothetical protein
VPNDGDAIMRRFQTWKPIALTAAIAVALVLQQGRAHAQDMPCDVQTGVTAPCSGMDAAG